MSSARTELVLSTQD